MIKEELFPTKKGADCFALKSHPALKKKVIIGDLVDTAENLLYTRIFPTLLQYLVYIYAIQ